MIRLGYIKVPRIEEAFDSRNLLPSTALDPLLVPDNFGLEERNCTPNVRRKNIFFHRSILRKKFIKNVSYFSSHKTKFFSFMFMHQLFFIYNHDCLKYNSNETFNEWYHLECALRLFCKKYSFTSKITFILNNIFLFVFVQDRIFLFLPNIVKIKISKRFLKVTFMFKACWSY